MAALVAKEFRQAWRSFRLPALLLVLLFLAIMDPLASRYMGEILARFAEGITIVVPPPSSAQAMGQFLGDIVELGILVVIGITMGSVATEKASGVASFIVTRPVSRLSYVSAKLAVLLGGLTVGVAGTTTLASLYSMTLIGPVDFDRVVLATVSVWIYAVFILCATFAASMAANGALAAGGSGFAVYLIAGLAGALLGSTSAGPYLPSTLVSSINVLLDGPANLNATALIGKPASIAISLSALFLYLGFRSFRKQDLP